MYTNISREIVKEKVRELLREKRLVLIEIFKTVRIESQDRG